MRFARMRKNRVFQKKLHEDWSEEGIENGLSPCESVGGQAVGIVPSDKAEIEEADGSGSRQEESVSLSLFLEVKNLEVEGELSTMATLPWAEGAWLGKWERANDCVEEADFRSADMETGERACRSSSV